MQIPKDVMNKQRQESMERFVDPNSGDTRMTFGPPEFDDEELEQEATAPAPQQSPSGRAEEDRYDMPTFSRPTQQEQERESLRQEGNAFIEDELLFEGGPTRTELMSWKKQFEVEGHTINLSPIGDDVFIWRTLSRVEYREIMAIPNTDPLQREEIICEVCILYPYNYNFKAMADQKAGLPAILAEQIMKESGFSKPEPPVRL